MCRNQNKKNNTYRILKSANRDNLEIILHILLEYCIYGIIVNNKRENNFILLVKNLEYTKLFEYAKNKSNSLSIKTIIKLENNVDNEEICIL